MCMKVWLRSRLSPSSAAARRATFSHNPAQRSRGRRAASARRPMAIVNGWLDALWQEEALALTSQ